MACSLTAKTNGIEPYRYLRHIFEKLPFAKNRQDLIRLTPQNVSPKQLTHSAT